MVSNEQLLADAKEVGVENPEQFENEAQLQDAIDQKLSGAENTTAPDPAQDEGESTSIIPEEGEEATPALDPTTPDSVEPAPSEPTTPEPTEPEKTPEELEVERQQAEAAAEAKRKADEEQKAMEEEQARLEAEAKAEKPSEGSEIAAAIREGLAGAKEDKRIKITADKSVRSQFAVVRSKRTGELMIRENATGVLSKVQLKSIEEKEADLQSEEVEEL